MKSTMKVPKNLQDLHGAYFFNLLEVAFDSLRNYVEHSLVKQAKEEKINATPAAQDYPNLGVRFLEERVQESQEDLEDRQEGEKAFILKEGEIAARLLELYNWWMIRNAILAKLSKMQEETPSEFPTYWQRMVESDEACFSKLCVVAPYVDF